MKRFLTRATVAIIASLAFAGCIVPSGPMYGGGWGNGGFGRSWGPGFVGNGGGWNQPMNVQPGFVGGPVVTPNGVVGGWNQTPMAAQANAQAIAAGAAPPVAAYQNPSRPIGYVVGTGQPTWSMQQCWNQGCVMP